MGKALKDATMEDLEKEVWERIRSLVEDIQAISVPDEKVTELEEELYYIGHISPSDGEDYAVRIEPEITDNGTIVFIDENGDEVDIYEDIYEHDLIYDPFGLYRWLKDIYETTKKVIGGE